MTTLAGASQDVVRRHNLSRLLRLLHLRGAMSRSALAAETGLNRSTIGGLTTELADLGLVDETAPVGQGVGRPSIMVEPVPESAYVLAIDVEVGRTVAAVVGLGGTVLARRQRMRRSGAFSPDAVLAQVGSLVAALRPALPDGGRLVGVGVAVPGVVRHDDGLVRFAPNLGWTDVPFGDRLRGHLALTVPLVVGNDADFGAIAEHLRGAAVGASDCIYLAAEIGIGGGVIIDDRPLRGAGGYGGEVGHLVVRPRGHRCRCGSQGCWETEIGEEAILRATGLDDGRHRVADAFRLAAAGDPGARRGLNRIARWLGIGVASLVNLFNPDVVVLGGTLREVYAAAAHEVDAQMARALSGPRGQVRLALPALGADSTLLGAAETAFIPLLDDPVGAMQRPRRQAS